MVSEYIKEKAEAQVNHNADGYPEGEIFIQYFTLRRSEFLHHIGNYINKYKDRGNADWHTVDHLGLKRCHIIDLEEEKEAGTYQDSRLKRLASDDQEEYRGKAGVLQ